MGISTTPSPRRKASGKPSKPYAEFPLTPHQGGKWMKHVHRTIADAARNSLAIDLIMGHCDSSMADRHRERVNGIRPSGSPVPSLLATKVGRCAGAANAAGFEGDGRNAALSQPGDEFAQPGVCIARLGAKSTI